MMNKYKRGDVVFCEDPYVVRITDDDEPAKYQLYNESTSVIEYESNMIAEIMQVGGMQCSTWKNIISEAKSIVQPSLAQVQSIKSTKH